MVADGGLLGRRAPSRPADRRRSRCFATAPTSAPAPPRSRWSGTWWSLIFFQPQYLEGAARALGDRHRPADPAGDGADDRDLAARGRLIARFGARGLMTVGMLAGVAGLVFLTQITDTSGYGRLLPGYLLFGVALGLVYAPMSSAAMAAMPPREDRDRLGRAGDGPGAGRRPGAGGRPVRCSRAWSTTRASRSRSRIRPGCWSGCSRSGAVLTWLLRALGASGPRPIRRWPARRPPRRAAPPPSPPPLPPLAVRMAQRASSTVRSTRSVGEAYPGRMAAVEPTLGHRGRDRSTPARRRARRRADRRPGPRDAGASRRRALPQGRRPRGA